MRFGFSNESIMIRAKIYDKIKFSYTCREADSRNATISPCAGVIQDNSNRALFNFANDSQIDELNTVCFWFVVATKTIFQLLEQVSKRCNSVLFPNQPSE